MNRQQTSPKTPCNYIFGVYQGLCENAQVSLPWWSLNTSICFHFCSSLCLLSLFLSHSLKFFFFQILQLFFFPTPKHEKCPQRPGWMMWPCRMFFFCFFQSIAKLLLTLQQTHSGTDPVWCFGVCHGHQHQARALLVELCANRGSRSSSTSHRLGTHTQPGRPSVVCGPVFFSSLFFISFSLSVCFSLLSFSLCLPRLGKNDLF